MTTRNLFCICVLICFAPHSIAEKDDKKCTKLEGRTDSQITTLRKHLLCNYDKQTAPTNASIGNRVQTEVYLGGYRVSYDTPGWGNTGMYNKMVNMPYWFTMSTYVFLSWKDERLQWNKSEHNNQTRINFKKYDEIWAPRMRAPCAKNIIFGENNGEITSFCWTRLIGNCRPVFFSWGDRRECVLSFHVEPQDEIQLHRVNETFDMDYYMSNSASWSVVKAKRIFPQRPGQENADLVKLNQKMPWKYSQSYFETKVVIQKNFAIQDAAVFAPAAVLLTLLLSSTWIPAKQEARVALLSIIVIVQVFMFHQACRKMPLSGHLANIVGLYQDLIICSGAAVVEWILAYFIACREEPSTRHMSTTIGIPGPYIFSIFKTISAISGKDSKGISTSLLLDRIFFLLLAIFSFILVVIMGERPPSVPFHQEELHKV